MCTACKAQSVTRRCYARDGARAYVFQLPNSKEWLTYVGPVRNKSEARSAIEKLFGTQVAQIRVHPVCDPWLTRYRFVRTIRSINSQRDFKGPNIHQ